MVHLYLGGRTVTSWAQCFSPGLLDFGDYPLLQYQAHAAAGFFRNSGQLWGYDPFFLGGYVLTFIWNSNVLAQVLAVVLPFLSVATVVKLHMAGYYLTVPFLLYGTFRCLHFSKRKSLLFSLFGVVYFHASQLLVMYWAVTVNGCLVYILSIFGFALLYHYLLAPTRPTEAAMAVLFPLALLTHKTATFTLAFPSLFLILAMGRSLTARHLRFLLFILVLTLAVNAFWILPLLSYLDHMHYVYERSYWVSSDPLLFLKHLFTSTESNNFNSVSGLLANMIVRDLIGVFSVVGLVQWMRGGRRPLAGAVIAVASVFFVLVYFGSFWVPTQKIDPIRYVPFLFLFLSVPALDGAVTLLDRIGRRRWTSPVIAAVSLALLCLPSSADFVRSDLGVDCEKSARQLEIAEWICANTTDEARVMVETYHSSQGEWKAWMEPNGVYSSLNLPMRCPRLYLGGFYSGFFVDYNFPNFYSGIFCEKPIREMPLGELLKRMDLYNVGWIVAWSDPAVEALKAHPEHFPRLGTVGGYEAFRVPRKHRFFLRGDGRVEVDYCRIALSELEPDEGVVELSYHWTHTLETTPEATMEPFTRMDDPNPFIRLVNPPRELVIHD